MKDIQIKCDRCNSTINGTIDQNERGYIITGGYYIVSDGFWKSFRRNKEVNV